MHHIGSSANTNGRHTHSLTEVKLVLQRAFENVV